MKIDRKMPIRTAGPPMNSSRSSARDLGHRAVGRRDHQPRLLRDPPRRIAKEIHHQRQRCRGQRRQIPTEMRPATVSASQRPAHQLQFGQAPAGKRNAAPPAERIIAFGPPIAAAIAAILQVAGIEDLVRGILAVALAQRGHAGDIARAEVRKPPSPPAAPEPARSGSTPRRRAARFGYSPAAVPAWRGLGWFRGYSWAHSLFNLPSYPLPGWERKGEGGGRKGEGGNAKPQAVRRP